MRRVMARHCPDIPMRVAPSLKAARDSLSAHPVGLIFLDNILSDGSGIDFAEELHNHPKYAKIPVVMVSDFPTPFLFAKAKAANVREIWSKAEFRGPDVRRAMARYALH
ncbi:Response regulator receiver domain-containing protein [Tropicibacter naphthalenivorans]|uniref:Response regulator of citrate/malate metabolism n=2 Tax=Tropicibacter naphthalenivorans TaxID=441103 RepID=A0A0P1G5V6_9RHOB|nr:Response regulator of citrate/malate metabolism [Tropicibacter naphthalenivorans]SMC60568.1 Response regulator receiver domain-containing protein [Tropicibacter naphthalenivorans]